MRRTSWLGLSVVLALAACGKKEPSVDDAIKAMAPRVDDKLAAIEGISAKATGLDGSVAHAATGHGLITTVPTPSGDTVLIYDTDLAALAKGANPPADYDRHLSSDSVIQCWFAMKRRLAVGFALSDSRLGEFESRPMVGLHVPMMCDELAQAGALAVVHVGATQGATAATPDDAARPAEQFTGGNAAGHVDMFELPSGSYLGRRPFAVASSRDLVYKTDSTGAGAAMDLQAAANTDLAHQVHLAIENAIAGR